MTQESLISEYRAKRKDNNQQLLSNRDALKHIELSLQKKQKEINTFSFLKKLFAFSLKSKINALSSEKANLLLNVGALEKNKKKLYDDLYQNMLISFAIKNNPTDYQTIKASLSQTNELLKAISNLFNSGHSCIQKINTAIDSIESAKTTEMMDLFSNNSGIKMMSTLNNHAAHQEVVETNQIISQFIKDIEGFKEKEASNIQHIIDNSQVISLNFDVTLDFLFDFYSFFTLSALSDTEEQLSKLLVQITDVVDNINQYRSNISEYLKQIENKKQAILEQQKNHVVALLNSSHISL